MTVQDRVAPSPALLEHSFDCSLEELVNQVGNHLKGADDGELFVEYAKSEVLTFDNGKLKSASYDTSRGFGLRGVADEAVGYAHSGELSLAALGRAGDSIRPILSGHSGAVADGPNGTNRHLYTPDSPLDGIGFDKRVALLQTIDAWCRDADPLVAQVTVTIIGSHQSIAILRLDGEQSQDQRPLVRLNVSVVMEKDGRREAGFSSVGGRHGFDVVMDEFAWQDCAREALRQARVNLDSVAAPAGSFDVVLGPGWPGVMLHEAVGHGLEGDFNRKETSAFSGRIGEQVAARGVTVVDDGTLDQRRGSLTIDDEGTPSSRTVLIEDGILVGYMQDRQNARLMNTTSTGNGRRQSYAHCPMPRMTNTYMLGGDHEPAEIFASVKNGIFAASFGGGQVDITSGKYVFNCTEAYRIENGKIGAPLKGAMMIGNGPTDMQKIAMLGNDMALDPGMGLCGKNGQSVPVGVGQPTTLIKGVTIGGTEA